MIPEMSDMSKEYDKENPPRHQVRALTDEPRRDEWKPKPCAKVFSLTHLLYSCLVSLLGHS